MLHINGSLHNTSVLPLGRYFQGKEDVLICICLCISLRQMSYKDVFVFLDDGVFWNACFLFAAVLSGLKDRRTVVCRLARRTTGCHPGGCPGKWGELGLSGSFRRLVRGTEFCCWSGSFPLWNRLILLPACGGQERVTCVWICWFLFCVVLCMCLELCENLEKRR